MIRVQDTIRLKIAGIYKKVDETVFIPFSNIFDFAIYVDEVTHHIKKNVRHTK